MDFMDFMDRRARDEKQQLLVVEVGRKGIRILGIPRRRKILMDMRNPTPFLIAPP